MGKETFFSGKDYIYENDSLKSIVSYQFLQSYGLVYSAATKALGFKMLRHEGKLTGLAAFGNPNLLSEKIYQYYKTLFLSKFQISDKYKGNFKFKNIIRKRFTDKLVIKYSNLLSNWVVFFESLIKDGFTYKDIAAGVQDFLEKMVLIEIDELKKNYSLPKNIVLAGGIFANVELNQKIWELGYFEKMFVQPAMDDAGTALGAAATKSKKKSLEPTLRNTVYLGSDKLEANLNDLPLIFSKSIISVSEIGTLIHNYLSAGKIIGYYQGRTEWGPRALGNRSILASAFNNDIPSKLNMRLKRNDFMPFAPIVRDIDAFKLFENYSTGLLASKFMTVTLTVRNQYKNLIPSVIHVDSTARPQILFKEDNQPLYEILNEVAVYHEIGIVLNTSFNLHEFPILDSFQTALDNLEKGAVDLLVVNGQLLISLKN
jgi:carbamoyltransferase